jgi:hypothetical protein
MHEAESRHTQVEQSRAESKTQTQERRQAADSRQDTEGKVGSSSGSTKQRADMQADRRVKYLYSNQKDRNRKDIRQQAAGRRKEKVGSSSGSTKQRADTRAEKTEQTEQQIISTKEKRVGSS